MYTLKLYKLVIALIILIAASSCTNDKGPPPPTPPDPFPVEWSTLLYNLTNSKTEGDVTVRFKVWVNEDFGENVKINYTVYELIENSRVQIESKEIYNKKVALNTVDEFLQKIALKKYGKYQIILRIDYNGWGKDTQYFITYTEQFIKSGNYKI